MTLNMFLKVVVTTIPIASLMLGGPFGKCSGGQNISVSTGYMKSTAGQNAKDANAGQAIKNSCHGWLKLVCIMLITLISLVVKTKIKH